MEELTPVPCGCGGEAKVIMLIPEVYAVECSKCWIRTGSPAKTEVEAITTWNKAMSGNVQKCAKDARCSERTAKVIEHDASITDTDGYKYYRTECLCGNCKKKVLSEDDYCSHCGARLDWE